MNSSNPGEKTFCFHFKLTNLNRIKEKESNDDLTYIFYLLNGHILPCQRNEFFL